MKKRYWLHWLALAAAAMVPLVIARVLLNETVACRQFDLALITVKGVFDPVTFRIAPPVYDAIYQFGIASTVLALAVVSACAVGIGIVVASIKDSAWRAQAVVLILVFLMLILQLPMNWTSPHSCISRDLIEVTAGNLPDDDEVPVDTDFPIGNTGASLKDAFNWIYRITLAGWLMSVVAIGALVSRIRLATPKAEREQLVKQTNARLTTVVLTAGALLALCMVAVHRYYQVGLSVLQASLPATKDTTVPPEVAAYQAYSSVVELHWGGVGSMVVAAVYLTGLGFIWLRTQKWGIVQSIAPKESMGLIVKLISISAPFLTSAIQQFFAS